MKRTTLLFIISIICMTVSCGNNKNKSDNGNQTDGGKQELQIVVKSLQTVDVNNISVPSKGLFVDYKNDNLGIYANSLDNEVFVQFDTDKLLKSRGIFVEGIENKLYKVGGFSDKCIGLFVGDIGQDTRPVLCILMEDGHIEILDLLNALQYEAVKYGFITSGRLDGFENIVAFENAGGGEYEMDGKTMYSYVTIYAIDKSGERHEINLFESGGKRDLYIEHGGTTEDYQLYLSPDWKIGFTAGWYMSELSYEYFGHFSEISRNANYDRFELSYEMTQHTDYADYENVKKSDVHKSGEFSVNTENNPDWTVVSKKGLTFGGKLNTPIVFSSPREINENQGLSFADKAGREILSMPETKNMSLILESEPTPNAPYYIYKCGENNKDNFVTIYWFHVYENPYEIKVYDVVFDREMTLDEWRADK
ncbi:MAG: hypothetical protein PHD07_06790 [Bacteroidales bacterium]|nr:hypothetical protein [Bacteroidales bacterium]